MFIGGRFTISKFRVPKSGLITVIWKWLIESDGSDNSGEHSSSTSSGEENENEINDDSEPEEKKVHG